LTSVVVEDKLASTNPKNPDRMKRSIIIIFIIQVLVQFGISQESNRIDYNANRYHFINLAGTLLESCPWDEPAWKKDEFETNAQFLNRREKLIKEWNEYLSAFLLPYSNQVVTNLPVNLIRYNAETQTYELNAFFHSTPNRFKQGYAFIYGYWGSVNSIYLKFNERLEMYNVDGTRYRQDMMNDYLSFKLPIDQNRARELKQDRPFQNLTINYHIEAEVTQVRGGYPQPCIFYFIIDDMQLYNSRGELIYDW